MSERKRFRLGPAVVNISNMPHDVAEVVVNFAAGAMKAEMTEQAMATAIKAAMVKTFPHDTWQVFVGRNFSVYVTHEAGKQIYFYIGQMAFCIYSS